MEQVGAKLGTQLSDCERQRLIAVGSSGQRFAMTLKPIQLTLAVSTAVFSREREKRDLLVEQIDYCPVAVDDLAVSGLTLSYARRNITPIPEVAAVGMLYKSKTTRRRTTFEDIRSGIIYSRMGGGNPPINSLATLKAVPQRLEDITDRYFNQTAEEFKRLIGEMK